MVINPFPSPILQDAKMISEQFQANIQVMFILSDFT